MGPSGVKYKNLLFIKAKNTKIELPKAPYSIQSIKGWLSLGRGFPDFCFFFFFNSLTFKKWLTLAFLILEDEIITKVYHQELSFS